MAGRASHRRDASDDPGPASSHLANPTGKAILQMTTHAEGSRSRRRAAIIGLGLDGQDGPYRIIKGEECILIGGSEETHAELLETMLRLESELDRLGRGLGEVAPAELAELAWRIDSPELHEIALRIESGLAATGQRFEDLTPEELTALATGRGL